ncbi:MAG TPA: MaoC/PaaZ C-terminal domain-containing protein [Candidatus Binatia bacterium]|nr:MaoC/PaaZ C-terminal domain-containing protein [Candidatus Binatia bacterium]
MKPLTFEEMPAPANLQALRTLRRKPGAQIVLPPIAAEAKKVRVDAAHLRRYQRICGFAEQDVLPLPYPQVTAAGLQMHVMTRAEFPLPLLGLVHLGNRIEQERPLEAQGSYTVTAGVENGRQTERGFEFELYTRWRARDGEVWRAVATILFRNRKPPERRKPPAEEAVGLSDYALLDAPGDIGRRYGRIAGDMNPIHLYPLTAKAFGFPRHIAHGMWSMARCAALLEPSLGRPPRRLDTRFRQPLLLPARAALRSRRAGEAMEFALLGRDSGKLHLNGSLG